MPNEARLPNIVILDTEQESNEIDAFGVFSDAVGITLYGHEDVPADTFVFQVTYDIDSAVWFDYVDDNGDPIAPPAAEEARTYFNLPSTGGFRIRDETGAANGADYIWYMTKLWKRD